MREKIFLYRVAGDEGRDACVYIDEDSGSFECGHYFAGIRLGGPCWSGRTFDDYSAIETVLTKEEYSQLVEFDRAIHNLGYGITKGDERYQLGIQLNAGIAPVFERLRSPEAEEFFDSIKEEEDEWLMNEYGLDEEDLALIFDEYGLGYHDRSVVSCVYDSTEDLGYEEALELGYIKEKDPVSMRYFDYEKFGEDLAAEDEWYVELADGRVACLSY